MSPLSQTLQHILGWSGERECGDTPARTDRRCGSINNAAKEVGLSYKAAWEKIETLNNLSENLWSFVRSAAAVAGVRC